MKEVSGDEQLPARKGEIRCQEISERRRGIYNQADGITGVGLRQGSILTMTIDELLDEVRQELAQARGIQELKRVRRKALVIRYYAKYARLGLKTINQAAEFQLRAERKLGQLLRVILGDGRDNGELT